MTKVFFKKRIKNNKGFTLVELLVTIVIFVILTGIVLFNQSGFNNGILLKNLAYDIALNVKQVQTYGIAVRESQTASNFSSYGIYLNLLTNDKSLILFADTDSNNIFNSQYGEACPVGDLECIQKYSISRGSYVKDICVNSDNLCGVTKLTVLFKRPNPDALIYYPTSFSGNSTSTSARIILSSATGATTSVIVTNAGQIYVGN